MGRIKLIMTALAFKFVKWMKSNGSAWKGIVKVRV